MMPNNSEQRIRLTTRLEKHRPIRRKHGTTSSKIIRRPPPPSTLQPNTTRLTHARPPNISRDTQHRTIPTRPHLHQLHDRRLQAAQLGFTFSST